jgi:hypothetical protein
LNPQLKRLQNLYSNREITNEDFVYRANALYRMNTSNFKEEDVDFIEKLNKRNGLDFNRDMRASEANLGDTLNQFASGVVEGFTTLGWSAEPATTTQGIANKLGHLIGFAPDIITSVLSMGAAVPAILGKRAIIKAGAKGLSTGAKLEFLEQGAKRTVQSQRIKGTGQKLAGGMGAAASKISIGGVTPFAKGIRAKVKKDAKDELKEKAGRDVIEELGDIKGWQIRSIPMRIADSMVENATKRMGSIGLDTQGFFAKSLFQNKTFRKVAHDSAHLGIALGASAVWKGPKAIAESTMHGALAGAVFGSIGEFVNISRLMSNPKTRELGKAAVRKHADDMSMEKQEILNAFARGTMGAGFQGGMSTAQGAPLPDQMYEYLMGFFFGANTKSVNEIKFRKIIAENPMLDGNVNIEGYKKQIKESEGYKESRQETKDMFEEHFDVLYIQQQQRQSEVGLGDIINVKLSEKAKEKGIDLNTATPEQRKELSKEVQKEESYQNLPEFDQAVYREKIESDAKFVKELDAFNKKNFEEMTTILKEETGIDFAELLESKYQADINEPIRMNRALDSIYNTLREDVKFEDYSKADLERTLLNVIKDADSYTTFVKNFKSEYPNYEVKPNEVLGNPLKSFFIRAKSYIETQEFVMDASGDMIPIGYNKAKDNITNKISQDKQGSNLVNRESRNAIDIRYGQTGTRIIVRLSEDAKVEGGYESPLAKYTPKELMKKLNVDNKKYYIYGGSKDKGTVVLQRIPFPQNKAGKKAQSDVVSLLLKEGVPPEQLKGKLSKTQMASNFIYKLVDNGYLTQANTTKQNLAKAMKEFRQDVKDGLINIDVLKEVKYEPLYQGKGIPTPSIALKSILDYSTKTLGATAQGRLNLVAIKDRLNKVGKESTDTDGGLIIRDDMFDMILDLFGMSSKGGFMKPVIRASARDGKGEIRGKVGGFRPESEGLNKYMMDNNIHMMIYGTGLKSKGKMKLNELIDGPNDTWSLKDNLDIAKIMPEEVLINPDVTDYVYKQLIEINKNGNLKIYKQLLDKTTNQDFPLEFFEAIETLRQRQMDGLEQANKKFITDGLENTKFKIDDISIQNLVNTLVKDPTSPAARSIIEQIMGETLKNETDMSDSMNVEIADLAELGLTPNILKKVNYNFNVLMEYKNFTSNKLARYVINRSNQLKVRHGFKAYAGLYTVKMRKDFNLKDTEFMLGDEHKNNPTTIEGVEKPMRLEDVFNKFSKMKKSDPEYRNYKEALTFLVMRTPNSGVGGVRPLLLIGFKKKGGFNFFANALNNEYLGGMDKDGDTVTGYQSLPGSIKAAFAKDNVFRELQNGSSKNPVMDLKAGKDKHPTGVKDGDSIVTKIISGMQSGADISGLQAGEALGIPTGGTGTKGHKSEAGTGKKSDNSKIGLKENLELAKRFDIKEGESTNFRVRTELNVDNSNATIAFRTQRSPGTDGTIGYSQTGKWSKGNTKEGIYSDGYRPVLVLNNLNLSKNNIKLIQEFVKKHPGVLNIAGSRESSVPGSTKKIKNLLVVALSPIKGQKVKGGKDTTIAKDKLGIEFGEKIDLEAMDTSKPQDKIFGKALGNLISSEMRLKAAQGAYEGKKATGVIVNATTNFQMLFDMVKNNGGRIDLGDGQILKIKLDDFNYLKEYSYTAINTAVDSSEYLKINKAQDNVQKMWETFFDIEVGGTPIETKWYKISNYSYGSNKMLKTFSGFSRAINSKKGVTFNESGSEKTVSLIEKANDFIASWGEFSTNNKSGKDISSNYYLQTAKQISKLDVARDIFSFSYAKPDRIIQVLERVYANVNRRPIYKELGLVDMYRDLDPTLLKNDLKAGKNIRGKVNNLLGIDILTQEAEKILFLMDKAGYDRSSIMTDLSKVIQNTIVIKQKMLRGEEATQEIINSKRYLQKQIESKMGNGKKLKKEMIKKLNDFQDIALLAHPVVKLNNDSTLFKVSGVKKKMTVNQGVRKINKLQKEIMELNPKDEIDFEYTPEITNKLRQIRNIEEGMNSVQERLTFESPAINPRNIKRFFDYIDKVYTYAAEAKVNPEMPIPIEGGVVKLSELSEGLQKEITKNNKEAEEVDLKYEDYVPIESINFERLLASDKVSDMGKIELIRLRDFLTTYKGLTKSIDVLYERFLQGTDFGSFEISKPFSEASAVQLKRFNDYLMNMSQPGIIKGFLTKSFLKKPGDKIIDKETGEEITLTEPRIVGAPNWATQFINTHLTDQLMFIESISKDNTYQSVSNVVVDKSGTIKIKKGQAPISVLQYNTELALAFHQLQNAKDSDIQKQIEDNIRLIKPEDSKQVTDFNALFKFTMLDREYNGGKFYEGVTNKNQQKNIAEKHAKFKIEFDRMIEQGVTFKFADPSGKKGERIARTPEQVKEVLNESYTNLMTQVLKDVIQSRYPQLRKQLSSVGKEMDLYKGEGTLIKNPRISDDIINNEIFELSRIFLDKNGMLTDMTKIDALYANLGIIAIKNPLQAIRRMPSLTDTNFIRYYQKMNDHLSRKYPEINFNKELSNSDFLKVRNEIELFKKTMDPKKQIGIGRLQDYQGIASKFVPHTGLNDTVKRRELNAKAIEDKIENDLKRLSKNPNLLARIDMKFAKSERTEADIEKSLLRMRAMYEDMYREYKQKSLSPETDATESAVIEDFTLGKPMDVFRSNQNLKARGKEISMPEWELGINHVERYVGAQYRNLLNSNLSLKINNNIKRFVERNPFGTDKNITESWAYFMMDVAKNQMGLPSLRNFDIHGITESELDLLKKYMKNDLIRDGFKTSLSEKHFLDRIDSSFGLNTFQKAQVNAQIGKMRKQKMSIDTIESKASNMEKNFKLNNIRDLAQGKNVNKIGIFNPVVQLVRDESVVKFTEKMDKIFGGRILKDAPKNRKDRDMYISRMGSNLSALEGKFEMMSLLFHPKTFITNIYGGGANTITDVGLKPFTQALSDGWWKDNVWGENTTYTIRDSASDKVIVKKITNRREWEEWQAFIGTFEDMLVNEAIKDIRFQNKSFILPFEQAAKRVNNYLGRNGRPTNKKSKKEYDDYADLTLNEAAREAGVYDAVNRAGATFMKSSEFILRSRTWDAAYINARNILGEFGNQLPFDSPILIEIANRTVAASQFIYHATQRPNIANSSMGRIMTRFHPYAWNSIGRRIKAYRGAGSEEWSGGVKTKRAQRQLTADMMSLALANVFVASIFDYALSPPMNWMQDFSMLLFGDKEERERAFFSQYPHPILSPLSIVTPPAARFVLAPVTALLNQDIDNLVKFQAATYLPFGRFGRDVYRTYQSPAMVGERMFGLPIHTVHKLRRDQIKAREAELADEMDEIGLE